MKRTLLTLLLAALPAFGVNFSYVQSASDTSGAGTDGTRSAAFGSNVTAGNAIIVVLYRAVVTSPTPVITDTRGNTYTQRQLLGSSSQTYVFSADHITGGADTVTASSGGGVSMIIVEYHSVSLGYCFGSGANLTGGSVFDVAANPFTSAVDTLMVEVIYNSGRFDTYTLTTGTQRFDINVPGGGLNPRTAFYADQDSPSGYLSTYQDNFTSGSGAGASQSTAVFIYVGGCGLPPPTSVFQILY